MPTPSDLAHFTHIQSHKFFFGLDGRCEICGESFPMAKIDMNFDAPLRKVAGVGVCQLRRINDLVEKLNDSHACSNGIDFLLHGNNGERFTSVQQAWEACDNPEWMLWFIAWTIEDNTDCQIRRRLVKALLEMTDLMPVRDNKIEEVIQTVYRWTISKASAEDCVAARYVAHSIAFKSVAAVMAENLAECVYEPSEKVTRCIDCITQCMPNYGPLMIAIIRKHFPAPPC